MQASAAEGSFSFTSNRGITVFAYLSYWYAALYVVIEGWRKLDLHDPAIDGLLQSPNVEALRRYRHSVFHFHENYINEPLTMPFITSPDSPVEWVRSVSTEFGRWFLDWFAQQP